MIAAPGGAIEAAFQPGGWPTNLGGSKLGKRKKPTGLVPWACASSMLHSVSGFDGLLSQGVGLDHFGRWFRPVPEGLGQQQEGAADEAAVGDVEHRPVGRLVPAVQEVPDAAEHQAVVEAAERAG